MLNFIIFRIYIYFFLILHMVQYFLIFPFVKLMVLSCIIVIGLVHDFQERKKEREHLHEQVHFQQNFIFGWTIPLKWNIETHNPQIDRLVPRLHCFVLSCNLRGNRERRKWFWDTHPMPIARTPRGQRTTKRPLWKKDPGSCRFHVWVSSVT